ETRKPAYAISASVALLMLALLAEPAGILTLISLGIGIALALFTVDDPDHHYRRRFEETLREWPWLRASVIGLIGVVVVAMVFLLYPQGLGEIGNTFDQLWKGITIRPEGYPVFFPLLS